jgi:hypothetical protein
MPTVPADFSFLSEDIKRQREIAEEALAEAKRLDSVIASSSNDPVLTEQLSKAKEKLLQIAGGLAANASHTSLAATVTISTGAGRFELAKSKK